MVKNRRLFNLGGGGTLKAQYNWVSERFAFTKPSRATSESERRECVNGNVEFSLQTRAVAFNARRSSFAFTLAEVLITLGIIGVVAAMTIPNLITAYQKRVTVESLKKMYSTLLQAAKSYEADYDESIDAFDTSLSAQEFMDKYFKPYLKVAKVCNSTADCWLDGKIPVAINGTSRIVIDYGYVLLNGSILAAIKTSGGALFFFDVDGAKGLNRSGHDIFNYYLINVDTMSSYSGCEAAMSSFKSGIYPGGYSDCYTPFTAYTRSELLGTSVHRACNKNSPNIAGRHGDGCAALIMKDGWQISKDYPW